MMSLTTPSLRTKLTDQQQEAVGFPFDMKINACAGSGKTTTLIAYAAARPAHSKILYLAFNRTVRLEAQTRFAKQGLGNVEIHTAHSLAYQHVMRRGQYKLAKTGDLSIQTLIDRFSLRSKYGTKTANIMAAHIRRYFSFFCNSAARSITDLNYLSTIDTSDKKALRFAQKYYQQIEQMAGQVFSEMNTGVLEITHDFYLKKFQLLDVVLAYDYILFDEGQDASETMLSVFLSQKAVKVIVGDQHQQIYGFRYAVNSLQRVDFPTLNLTSSFRFDSRIAGLANYVLDWKKYFDDQYTSTPIEGLGAYRAPIAPLHATIGRTNMSVLGEAIDAVCLQQEIGSVYFEGRFDTYTYMESGGSLFDILNLHLGRPHKVYNPLLKSLGDTDNLKEYIDLTGEGSMKVALEIVETYEEALPEFIQQIKDAHMDDSKRHLADRIFSTVHRCKGMEYDAVSVLDDFISLQALQEKLEAMVAKAVEATPQAYQRMSEEINMLYVAITRSQNGLSIPKEIQTGLDRQLIKARKKAETDVASCT